MEPWMIFAFVAPLFWGATGIIDKFLVDKHMRNPYATSVYLNILYFLMTLTLVFFVNLAFPLPYVLLASCIGVLSFFTYTIWFKAISIEDVSVATPLAFIYPVFAMLFAFIFLYEKVSLLQYVGAVLLIASSVLISMKKSLGKILVSPALKFMLVFSAINGASVVLEKFALGGLSFWALFFWSNAGLCAVCLATLLFSAKIRRDFVKLLKLKPRVVGFCLLTDGLAMVATLIFFFALTTGPATLVSAINAVQPFYVLLMVVVLSAFWPNVLEEKNNGWVLFLKALAIVLVLIGSFLLAA